MQGLRLVACTLLAVVLGVSRSRAAGPRPRRPPLPPRRRPSPRPRRRRSLLPLPSASASAPGTATASAASPAPDATLRAWVAVSVATLWVKPGLARAVDAPACADPADPAGWVESMTTEQKRWLVGRLETQALYGTPVRVLDTAGEWSRIVVPSQPTPRDSRGYPGWVPTRQLTTVAPEQGLRLAVVRQPRAWLWETPELAGRVLELSYGTRLQAVAWTPAWVEVFAVDGRHVYVRRSAVALHTPGTAWPRVTGADLVTEAERFLGLEYLWAGTAGFGYDCSGLTHAVHHALGTTIPRDAGPQGARGERIVTREALRAGDLVFFRDGSGRIHHVGLYVGDGRMIHAPRTGEAVTTVSIDAEPYLSEFAGGRRYWR